MSDHQVVKDPLLLFNAQAAPKLNRYGFGLVLVRESFMHKHIVHVEAVFFLRPRNLWSMCAWVTMLATSGDCTAENLEALCCISYGTLEVHSRQIVVQTW